MVLFVMIINSELACLLALSQSNPNIESACDEKGLLETNREAKRELDFDLLYQDYKLIRNCLLSHSKKNLGKMSH